MQHSLDHTNDINSEDSIRLSCITQQENVSNNLKCLSKLPIRDEETILPKETRKESSLASYEEESGEDSKSNSLNNSSIPREEMQQMSKEHRLVRHKETQLSNDGKHLNEKLIPSVEISLLRDMGNNSSPVASEEIEEEIKLKSDSQNMLRKASVAVVGGALITAGIPLIILPIPVGCIAVGSGFALLATEFPAAKKYLILGHDKLEEIVGTEDEDDSKGELDLDEKKVEKAESVLLHKSMNGLKTEKRSLADDFGENEKIGTGIRIENCCENAVLEDAETHFDEKFLSNREKVKRVFDRASKSLKRTARGTILPFMKYYLADPSDHDVNEEGSFNEKESYTDRYSCRVRKK